MRKKKKRKQTTKAKMIGKNKIEVVRQEQHNSANGILCAIRTCKIGIKLKIKIHCSVDICTSG